MQELALPLPPGEMHAKTVFDALLPAVEKILLGAETPAKAAYIIHKSDKLLESARASLPRVLHLATPINELPDPSVELTRIYADILLIYDPKDFGTGKAGENLQDAWFNVHLKVLGEFPVEALQIAADEYLRVGKFGFPKPADLYEVAKREAEEINLLAKRLRHAVNNAPPPPPPERRPEDVEKTRQLLNDVRGPDGRLRLIKRIPQQAE